MKRLVAREAAEALARKFVRQKKLAQTIRDKFRPRKAERGTVVLVGRNGKRLPFRSKRKAVPVYVTLTGKKRLYVRTQIKNPYALRPADNVKFSSAKNLRKVTRAFQLKRLKEVGRGKLIRASKARKKVASSAEKQAHNLGIEVTPGEYSESVRPKRGKAFDDRMVNTLAKSIKAAISTQKSHQVYQITALAEVEGQYGNDVVQVTFSMGRSEQYFFLENPRKFVRLNFYAEFAQQLAYLGYVTSGSANHIRRHVSTKVITQKVWEKYHGDSHKTQIGPGHEFNIVDLLSLEWKIERT